MNLHDCCFNLGNKYGLLTKSEVKMAGYWPSSFFFLHPAVLTEQAWSIKDLVYGFWRTGKIAPSCPRG